jgi:hypothetical protein
LPNICSTKYIPYTVNNGIIKKGLVSNNVLKITPLNTLFTDLNTLEICINNIINCNINNNQYAIFQLESQNCCVLGVFKTI